MLIEHINALILDGAYASRNSYLWMDFRIIIRNKQNARIPIHKNIGKMDAFKENVQWNSLERLSKGTS